MNRRKREEKAQGIEIIKQGEVEIERIEDLKLEGENMKGKLRRCRGELVDESLRFTDGLFG